MSWYYETIQASVLAIQLAVMKWSRTLSSFHPNFDYILRPQNFDAPRVNNDTIPIIKLAHVIDDIVVQITPNMAFSLQNNITFNLIMSSIFLVISFIVIVSIIINAIQQLDRKFNLFSFFERMFTVIENEFSVPRSLMIIITLLTSCLVLSSFMPIMSLKTPLMVYVFLTLAGLLLTTILLWPISLIHNWGTYFTIYIKGESTMSNLLGQVVMDYFYVVSFFLRINLQFLRLVVLSGVFIVYNEFYFEFIYPMYNYESINFSPRTWDDYAFIGFRAVIIAIFRFIYELGHMWAVLIMQANAFAMILFLILQSLHTVYLAQRLQAYFKAKRK